jgi:hypothetical protein
VQFQSTEDLEARTKAGEPLRRMFGRDKQSEDELKISQALAKVAAEHGIKSVTTGQ